MLITPADHPPDPIQIAEVVALVNRAYRGETAAQGWASEDKVLAGQRIDAVMLTETLSDGKTTLLLLRDAEHAPLAGCVSVARTAEPSLWHLGMLTIDPARQSNGLGRVLLDSAETYLRQQGADRVSIAVIWLRDTLLAWYQRRGFRPTGATEPFPYGDQRFGIPLRDDLYFVVLEKPLS